MKHLKKLSVVLMMTTLFSVTFTSCIDNEVSPLVEAIYEAQADLIAAQAEVQNAEATKLEAEAAYQLALAASVNATATYTLEQVETLKIANAAAQLVLDEAQAQFNIDLAFLLAELEEAGAQIALDYALKYRLYANAATNLLSEKATAVYNLAYAQAQANSSFPLYALQALETTVANAQYQVEVNEAKIAALQALIDNPNSLPAQVTAWEAELDALEIARDAKQAEVEAKYAERDNLIAGWDGEDDVRDNFVQEYDDQAQKVVDLSDEIEGFQDIIDAKTLALATYNADLTAAGTALTAAELAYNNAWTALGKKDSQGTTINYPSYFAYDAKTTSAVLIAVDGMKYATPANLQQVLVNATIDKLNAAAELSAITADIAALYGALQNAVNALAIAQANYNSGIATIQGNVTTAQTGVTNAQTALTTAQSYYATKKTIFEAAPTGLTWFDQTTPLGGLTAETSPFPNTRIGNHADAIATSYAYVTGWVEAPAGTWTPTTLSVATVATYPITASAYTAPVVSATIPSVLATTGFYVEVEADDLSETNAALLNDAVAKLGDNAIYDIAPALPANYPTTPVTYLIGTDAYTVLYNAELALLEAEYALDNYDTALVAAQAEYDYQKNLYDNELTILDAAQAANASAVTAYNNAKKAVDNAWATLGTEYTAGLAGDSPKWWVAKTGYVIDATAGYDSDFTAPLVSNTLTLNAVVYNAEIAKAKLVACNAICLQDAIDVAQHEIDLIQPSLDLAIALVAQMQAQYDIYMETYISGNSNDYDSLDADLKVQYDTLSFEIFQLNQELNDLDAEYDAIADILDNIDNDDNLSDISLQIELALLYDNFQGGYLDSRNDLAAAEAALAAAVAGGADNAAYIAYLQSVVDVLDQRYENALALAAKYKALMEAALAS